MNENEATDLVTALFDRWYMALVRYAVRTKANYDLAEDLAQDTFMQLYQALRASKNIEHPKGMDNVRIAPRHEPANAGP